MKIRLKLLLIILAFVLLYATYYWGIPAFVDIGHRVPLVQKIVKDKFGADIELKNPNLKMGLIPSVWLSADYLEVNDGKLTPLSIDNPKVKIQLLPLLFGKVNLSYFSADNASANLKIDKNYRIYIGNFPLIKGPSSNISVENSSLNLGQYHINVFDEIQNKEIIFDGDYLSIYDYNSKKHIGISTNSSIKIGNQISKINANVDLKLPLNKGLNTNNIVFDGSISNFNIQYLTPYVKLLSKNKIQKISGILNIEARTKELNRKTKQILSKIIVKDFSVLTEQKSTSVSLKDKLLINIDIDVAKNLLSINNFSATSGKIHLKLDGKVKKIGTKNPKLGLNLNINKTRAEEIVNLLPPENIKGIEINIPAIKKYGFYGDINGDIKIKGKSSKPDLTGSFIATKAYVLKPVTSATIKLDFLGQKIYLDSVVPMNDKEKVFVKGIIELYGQQNSNLDITSTKNIDLALTKTIIDPLHEMLYFDIGPVPDMQLSGHGNINLKTGGNYFTPKAWGVLNFNNIKGKFNDLNAVFENANCVLYFDNQNTKFITKKAFLNKQPIKIEGTCSLFGDLNFNVIANNQQLDKIIKILNSSNIIKEQTKNIPDLKNITGKVNLNLNLKGKVLNIDDFNIGKNIKLSGSINLLGNNLILSSLDFPINNVSGNIKFNNDTADFNLYSNFNKTKIQIKGNIKDNKLHSKIKLDDLKFDYFGIPVKIFNGNLEINNDRITLYKINGLIDSMPILADGFITNIFSTPNYNVYINSKPNQKFIDKYINKDSIYPLKIKGDIIYSSRLTGTKNNFNIKTEVNLQEDSSIYYMGATIGDISDPIRLYIDANIAKDSILVNDFQYDKLISSQNDKEFISHQLNASGLININKKNLVLHNFKIRTQNPTDSKIFNIMFKKSFIKEGLFSSDILVNGAITSPKIIGYLNFTGINIPILDTTIKDITLDFNKNDINIKTKGDVFSNNIVLFANMKNKLTPPYVLKDVDVFLGNLDINEILNTINKLDVESSSASLPSSNNFFDVKDLIVKNGKIKADSVFVKTIFAKDFSADFSLSDKLLFSLENCKFKVADGNVEGDYTYNLLNYKTDLNIIVDKVNANSMTESLFDLPNQIYGSLSGQAHLMCNAKTHKSCMNTLSGKGGFRVANGKLPKLGSLEYLLKAANIVKSGVTGVTINSVIDLVTPLKTGQFENINGMFAIDSGFANDIQIFSKGKDLSLFLTGTYNFSNLIANMQIFGRLSKKITNILGPVGNTSLNTLFNTIPGLHLEDANKAEFIKKFNKIPGFEFNDKKYRIFSVDIYGDINGDKYVQSFKWVD